MGVINDLLRRKYQEKVAKEQSSPTDLVAVLEKTANMSNENFLINLLESVNIVKLAFEGRHDKLSDEDFFGNVDSRKLLKLASAEIKRLRNQVSSAQVADDLVEKAASSGLNIDPTRLREIVNEGKEESVQDLISLTSETLGELADDGGGNTKTALERWQESIMNI